jgi:2,3-bisphosphoglycerate-independent phosphoglycerate mutase
MPGSGAVPLVALVILDGWGCAPPGPGNAVELANTPVFDRLWRDYPHTHLVASGEAVGLPAGQMGNSEVGHLTIGSGRVLDQDFQRVNRSIADGSFYDNDALVSAFRRARERGGEMHLLGLVSHGGVHSHIEHVRALLELARREGMSERTWIHPFTDGRDVSPTSAVRDLAELPEGQISSLSGRYYAMDRDKRWERTELALDAIRHRCTPMAMATDTDIAITAVQRSYDEGVTDEFIVPVCFDGRPGLDPSKDGAIFFNFRPDRARQLSEKLGGLQTDLTTMTKYREDFVFPVAFPEQSVEMVLAEVLAEHGVRQLHAAETEKYAHVTYFFNGGREEEFPGEERMLVPSPRDVPSYDHKPEMSAAELTDRFVAEVESHDYAFAVLNFANPDMVGHTGSIPAVVRAVETTDACLARVVGAVEGRGGVCLITADHGNAERMLADDGVSPHTAHTTNLVPLIVTEKGLKVRDQGELSDLAPTALALLGFAQPLQMTGKNVINRS